MMTAPRALSASGERLQFDISAQPLASALAAYAEQARILFLYQTELVKDLRSSPIRGRFSAAEALERLLRGTGIAYEFTSPDTIVLHHSRSDSQREPATPEKRVTDSERDLHERVYEPDSKATPATALKQQSAEQLDVTVTARRRSERLQEYAGSAAVFDAVTLERARIDGLEDIVNRLSNAYFEERPGSAINIFIRGAGTATNGSATQTDAAVGLYVDGIYSYLQGSRIPLVFYDMERIEVFKGPQGSLYGRNAVGGAVAAYTARPTQELETYLSLQRAEFNWSTAEARVNLPLGEAFSLRLSGYYDERDSYYSNIDPSRREPGEEVAAGRLRLRYQPSEALDVVLGYEHVAEDKGPQVIVPESFAVREEFVSVSDTDDFVDRGTDRFLATIDWDLSPRIEIRSISGYTDIDSLISTDVNNLLANPMGVFFRGITDEQLEGYQITQDLIAASTSESRFQWLAGVSYFEDHQESLTQIQSGFPPALANSTTTAESSTEMLAGFVDLSYRLTDRLVVDGSLRYSDERRTARRSNSLVIDPNTGLPFPVGAFQFRNRYSRVSPGGSLSIFWTDEIMTYAKVSTAYQSGGINSRAQNVDRSVFGPSTALNYELGAKTTWLERRLTANLSLFRMLQDDYQYQVNNPPFNEFQNIGEARTDGVEAELLLRLTDWLSVPLTYGYLDARLTQLTSPRAGTVQGQPLFGIPKNTATAGLDIELPLPRLGRGASFYLRADYAATRNRYLGANPVQLDDYETLDFKTGLAIADRYELYLFGENVLDDVHVITPSGLGLSRVLSPPGLFGAGFTVRF